jgi:opacity protein-like surface antigen
MRKLLLGAAAAVAMMAPGVANAADGYLELGYSSTDTGTVDVDTINFGGAVNFDLGGLEAQANVGYGRFDGGGTEYTLNNGGLHVFKRNDNFLIGGFAAVEDGFSVLGSVYDFGAEGQLYINRLTLDGGVSYTNFDTFDESGTTIRAGATYFITDNLSLGANGRMVDIDGDDITTYGATAEWQPASSQFSFFGGYRQTDETFVFGGDDTNTWSLGFRYNLGTDSLIERNRSGASLPTNGTLVGGIF